MLGSHHTPNVNHIGIQCTRGSVEVPRNRSSCTNNVDRGLFRRESDGRSVLPDTAANARSGTLPGRCCHRSGDGGRSARDLGRDGPAGPVARGFPYRAGPPATVGDGACVRRGTRRGVMEEPPPVGTTRCNR